MLLKNPDSFLGYLGENRYVDEQGEEFGKKEYEDSLKKKDSKRNIRLIEGYKNRFQPFVDECNAIQLNYPDKDNYVAYWRFIGTEENPNEVYWSEERNRWEIRIIICDSFGNEDDFGFTPEDGDGIDVDKLPNKDEVPVKLTEEDIKNINDADAEIKLIEKRIEIAKAEIDLIQAKAKVEIDIIEAKSKADKDIIEAKSKADKERVDRIIELTKLGYTKKEINKILGI
jgi:hypothetical protein